MRVGYGEFSLRELTDYMRGIKYFKFFSIKQAALSQDQAEVLFSSEEGLRELIKERLSTFFCARIQNRDKDPLGKRLVSGGPDYYYPLVFDGALSISIGSFRDRVYLKVSAGRYGVETAQFFALLREMDAFVDTLPIKPLENIPEHENAFVPLRD